MSLIKPISGRPEKIAVIVSRAIDILGGLVFLKLVSSHTSKADMGTYLLATSVIALLLTISFSALSQGILRNVSKYMRDGELPQRFSAALLTYTVITPVYAWASLSAIETLGVSKSLDQYTVILIIWITSDAIKTLNTSVASALRNRHLIGAATALDYTVKLSGVSYALFAEILEIGTVTKVLTFASITVSVFFVALQRRLIVKPTLRQCIATLNDSAKFAWPMVIWGAFGWAQNMSNRWIIEHFQGLDAVATLGVLTTIGTLPVNAIFGLLTTYAQPIIYQLEEERFGASVDFIKTTLRRSIPYLGILIASTIFFHDHIIALATDRKYADMSKYLPWITASVIISSCGTTLSYFALARNRGATLILANTIPGITSIVISIVLIPTLSVLGAVISITITHTIWFVLLFHNFRKLTKNLTLD